MDNYLRICPYDILVLIVILVMSLPFTSAALVIGTNSGFVTEAPVDDPDGGGVVTMDSYSRVNRDTSPETAGKITEIGWWCDTASEESNFEVGLYASDGEAVPGEAGTLLEVERTNAKGTTAGWKSVTVNWSISENTSYWLGVQLDNVVTSTKIDYETSGGYGYDLKTSATTLPNPYAGGAFSVERMLAIYAVWEAGEPPEDTCTCAGLNANWEIAMSDYCNITEACDLGTGTLSFTGAGWCNCNASVDTTNLGDPGASGVLYIQDSCLITID